jgi:Asp-tRNA(Asn)/Glu-tRNA(Gln) amidotransferase C subunit
MLWPLGKVVVMWYIFPRFGILCQKIWQPCIYPASIVFTVWKIDKSIKYAKRFKRISDVSAKTDEAENENCQFLTSNFFPAVQKELRHDVHATCLQNKSIIAKQQKTIRNVTPGPRGEHCPLGEMFTPLFTHQGWTLSTI